MTLVKIGIMIKLKAIIFDVDGTMADTEQFGHLPACNDAIKELGLDIYWTWETFLPLLLKIQGNANRLTYVLQEKGYKENDIKEIIAKFTQIKPQYYINKYLPKLQLRNGIKNIIQQAVESNVLLSIVTTSYEAQAKALIENQLPEYALHFKYILGKESGKKTDNDGFLYKKCLNLLGTKPLETIVIEDSDKGLKAAIEANIPTAVFFNDYTYGSDFSFAKLVAPSIKYFDLKSLEKICLNS